MSSEQLYSFECKVRIRLIARAKAIHASGDGDLSAAIAGVPKLPWPVFNPRWRKLSNLD